MSLILCYLFVFRMEGLVQEMVHYKSKIDQL